MLRLTMREKRLLVVLVIVLAFVLWYRVFSGMLLPRHQALQQELAPFSEMVQGLPELEEQVKLRERNLMQIESDLAIVRGKFLPTSGFLLTTLGKLAEDKVTIKEIEPKDTHREAYYQDYSMKVTIEGNYESILLYLQTLEDLSGIRIGTVAIQEEELSGLVESSFIIHHYVVPKEQGQVSNQPTFLYSPHLLINPFETTPIVEEIDLRVGTELEEDDVPGEPDIQSVAGQGDWALAPYIFPSR